MLVIKEAKYFMGEGGRYASMTLVRVLSALSIAATGYHVVLSAHREVQQAAIKWPTSSRTQGEAIVG